MAMYHEEPGLLTSGGPLYALSSGVPASWSAKYRRRPTWRGGGVRPSQHLGREPTLDEIRRWGVDNPEDAW